MGGTEDLKAKIREKVWSSLDASRVAFPRPCRGRIPLFVGARVAASKIARRSFFREARIVYSTPDPPQQPLREEALLAGKTLVMMAPGFRGFVIVRGTSVPRRMVRTAATLRGALSMGERVRILEGVHVDVFVTGSVAVDRKGGRLGRGDGRQDLEYAVLRELRLVDEDTPVVTTVHDLQVVSEVPMKIYDVPVDYIATPSTMVRAEGGYRKPRGVIWDLLDVETIERLPLLKMLFGAI